MLVAGLVHVGGGGGFVVIIVYGIVLVYKTVKEALFRQPRRRRHLLSSRLSYVDRFFNKEQSFLPGARLLIRRFVVDGVVLVLRLLESNDGITPIAVAIIIHSAIKRL